MSIIYKQVIDVQIEDNNVFKGLILSIATGKSLTIETINISTYTQLFLWQLTLDTFIYYLILKDILLLLYIYRALYMLSG